MLDAWRRQHFVPMPDETVPLCNFTLLMYSADTLEKWDLLNLRHRSIVQHAVLKQDYAGSDSRNMTRTEEKGQRGTLPHHTGRSRDCAMPRLLVGLQALQIYRKLQNSGVAGSKGEAEDFLKKYDLIDAVVSSNCNF